MAAVAKLILRIPALEKQPGFFVALLVQIMQQLRVGLRRQLGGQPVQLQKQRPQIRFGIRRRHGFDGQLQRHQRR